MKLGSYTFVWEPKNFTEPKADKIYSKVLTYSSVEFFSWGTDIVGKEISITGEWMKEVDFQNLQRLMDDDEQKTWDLEAPMRLYHDTVVNAPWVAGKSITGAGGAVGLISGVNIVDDFVIFSSVTGDFVNLEVIEDDSAPQKTSTVTGINIYPNFTVEVLEVNGDLHDGLTVNFPYRENVELKLLIMAVL